jgi:hypothetical protein
MERHLNAGDFEKAKQIYREGAHMGPYATLTLKDPITTEYTPPNNETNHDDNHIKVIGMTEDGQEAVYGTLNNQKLEKGQSKLSVSYHVTEDQYHVKHIPCAVGGRDEPNLEGCEYSSLHFSVDVKKRRCEFTALKESRIQKPKFSPFSLLFFSISNY